jgi:hypothetical protein
MTRTIIFAGMGLGVAVAATAFGISQKTDRPIKSDGYEVLKPITYKNLTIFPVVRAGDLDQKMLTGRYITLDEGLKKGVVEVREMGYEEDEGTPLHRERPASRQTNEFGYPQQQRQQVQQSFQSGAQVNKLALVNKSGMHLVLMAGEMVVGGKQDRIVQKDAIVPPSPKPIPLAVFCVEQGRWHGETASFDNQIGGGGGMRGGLADPSVRGTAQSKGDQGAVWGAVAKKQKDVGGGSATDTYQSVIMSPKAKKDTGDYVKAIEGKFPSQNVIGAIVAINGKLVWLDVFSGQTNLFEKYWPKLLRSYALDAISSPPEPKYDREQWPEVTVASPRFLTRSEC